MAGRRRHRGAAAAHAPGVHRGVRRPDPPPGPGRRHRPAGRSTASWRRSSTDEPGDPARVGARRARRCGRRRRQPTGGSVPTTTPTAWPSSSSRPARPASRRASCCRTRSCAPTCRACARSAELQDDDVFVSWLPLYHDMGLVGLLGTPMTTGARPRARRAAGLHRPAVTLDGVGVALRRHRHRRTQLRLGPRHPGPQPVRDPRPLARCASPSTAPSPSTPTASAPSSPRPRPTACAPARCSPPSAWPRSASPAPSPSRWPGCRPTGSTAGSSRPSATPRRSTRGPRGPRSTPCSARRSPASRSGSWTRPTTDRSPIARSASCRSGAPRPRPGYYENPEATAASFRDGWLCTGDLAYLLDGQLVVCGRIKDVIIVGGRNIFPEDVERAAGTIEGIRAGNVIAFGVEGRKGQEAMVVVAETKGEGDLAAVRRQVHDIAKQVTGLPPTDIVLRRAGRPAQDLVGQAAAHAVPPALPGRRAHQRRRLARYPTSDLRGPAIRDGGSSPVPAPRRSIRRRSRRAARRG